MASQEEVAALFVSIPMKQDNPSSFYKVKGKVNKTLYKAERKTDKKLFLMKNVEFDKMQPKQ